VVGYHPTDRRVGITSPGFKGLSDVTSTNWSGYADTGSSFSDVSASWTEPGASCSSRTTSLAAFWVGIDGYSSDSVEQDGTMIECYDRTAGSISSFTDDEITMIDSSGATKALPGALNGAGTGFWVSWEKAS
jgi:Peptidase A4 family